MWSPLRCLGLSMWWLTAEFPNVIPIEVSRSPNVVSRWSPLGCLGLLMWCLTNVVPIEVPGALNVVVEFPNVVPIEVSESLNVVVEFPKLVPIEVSGSLPMWSPCGPHWGLKFPM